MLREKLSEKPGIKNQQISVQNRLRKRNGNNASILNVSRRNRPEETQRNFELSGFRNFSELLKHLISPCVITNNHFSSSFRM